MLSVKIVEDRKKKTNSFRIVEKREYQEEKLRDIAAGKRGERYRMTGIKKRIQRREDRKKIDTGSWSVR